MARWHLSSNAVTDRLAANICERAGLTRSGEDSAADRCWIRAYGKRVICTENFLAQGAQNWICAAGTLVMNGKLGRQALSDCFRRFLSDGVKGVQAEALGHYAVAIRKGHEIWAFTDPLGAFDLYYLIRGDEWFLSNSLEVCAGAASSRKLDPLRLLVQTLQTYFPGEETFYSDVKRLLGCQAIHIDLRTSRCSVEAIPPSLSSQGWNLPNIEEAVCRYQAEVRDVFRNLASLGRIGVFGTGGLDSRTVLSALVDQKADIQLMYGIGNSRLTDYDQRDALLAQQVAREAGVAFQMLDWSGQQPHTAEKLNRLIARYGFRSEIYGSSDSFLNTLEGAISPYPQLLVGGYSPAFSSFKPWELDRNSFTFDELVADSMRFQGNHVARSQCLLDKASYTRVVSDAVRRTLALHGLDYPEQGADLRMFVRAKLLLYVRPESRLLNLVNEFGPYIAPFMIRRLYDPLLEVPFEYRKRDEFQLRLIHSLAPGLVRIPLYSGICPAHIDPVTLRFVRDPVQDKAAKRWAKCVIPPIARRVIRKLTTDRNGRNAAIRRVYGRQIMQDPLGRRWFASLAEFSPKDLARIRHYLAGVNLLGYTLPGL